MKEKMDKFLKFLKKILIKLLLLALLGGLTCWVYIHRRVIRSLLLGTHMPKCPHFLPRPIRRKLGA